MKHKPEVRRVPLNLLTVDLRVQRALDRRKVNRIAAELNPDAIGMICVSKRPDGTYLIIDGQHRVEALKITGAANTTVLCEVFNDLTLADEAAMFRWRNNTTQPHYIDRFRVRLVEGDVDVRATVDILHKYGWRLPDHGLGGASNGLFTAVQALERIYMADRDSDPTAAEKTIASVTAAWGHERDAVDGRLIEGLGRVYIRYGSAIDTSSMVDKMRKFPGGPGALIGKARGLRDLMGGTVANAFGDIFVEMYNHGKRTRLLPPWRSN